LTSEESRGVDIEFADGGIQFRSQSADVGQSKIELAAEWSHAPLTITLDPKYFGEFLKLIEPDELVHLELRDAESAVLVESGERFQYVLMPLSRD
jgi:DNA polymerase-3 subunit beta